ncbi:MULTISPECIES: hypothetical protein [Rhodococcus]|uniref:hypothetical protein n=1 Tax=Rhodococcus TaxID=1827 RepID=UPI00045CBE0E|nr:MULTISPECIES: hypothetical protein [Rhodococcus]KDE12325.1 hypothetical protein N505_0116040 [Rhodococcus aetherivorans]QIX51458.1 hypothetical protein HFP48_19185 [Rhodococcus sp. DMU1]
MRPIARAALIAVASVPSALAAPALASAASATDVSFAFTVSGSTVTNTITNNSGTPLDCMTGLAPAPGGVLPPVAEVIRNGQALGTSGQVQPGVTTQTVTEIPDGSYVVLASCSTDDLATMWVSDYPGIAEHLAPLPVTAYIVQEASPVVTVPNTPPIFGSS